ncbi:MAG: antibiotic biosynthesis monooxygenase [Deltaproteobacteria bacterium HGW-Deltaproteobacteria-10]|nr:MAG: antibiotic biosynthesis monooxygenase [Deltaproteobacteria bacterium HGW-Deltaproteobacteria-10]
MICVIATVNLKEGKKDDYLAELRKIIPDVLKEIGNIEYAPYIDLPSGFPVQSPIRPDTVYIVEKWESLDALKSHMNAPHMVPYRQATKDLVQSMQVQVLSPA